MPCGLQQVIQTRQPVRASPLIDKRTANELIDQPIEKILYAGKRISLLQVDAVQGSGEESGGYLSHGESVTSRFCILKISALVLDIMILSSVVVAGIICGHSRDYFFADIFAPAPTLRST